MKTSRPSSYNVNHGDQHVSKFVTPLVNNMMTGINSKTGDNENLKDKYILKAIDSLEGNLKSKGKKKSDIGLLLNLCIIMYVVLLVVAQEINSTRILSTIWPWQPTIQRRAYQSQLLPMLSATMCNECDIDSFTTVYAPTTA